MSAHETLFELLPAEGDGVSRDAAMTALGERLNRDIDDEEFHRCTWLLGERVVWSPQDDLIRRRRANATQELPEHIKCERDLEPCFERFIWHDAVPRFYDPLPRSFNLIVQNTARNGTPSGRWTRPDLCMVCISQYQYTPSPSFDLFSFELKMPAGCNVLAVHEALAHTAAAHFAYLGLYLPNGVKETNQLPGILEQAQRHGVGVIRISNHMDPDSYRVLLMAQRFSPSPAKLDGFIEDRFDEANRLALRRWVHR